MYLTTRTTEKQVEFFFLNMFLFTIKLNEWIKGFQFSANLEKAYDRRAAQNILWEHRLPGWLLQAIWSLSERVVSPRQKNRSPSASLLFRLSHSNGVREQLRSGESPVSWHYGVICSLLMTPSFWLQRTVISRVHWSSLFWLNVMWISTF